MLVTATDGTATAGGTEVLSLQLVDQYGNPVSSGLAVNVTVSGSATFSANDVGGSNGSNALSGTLSGSGAGSITITNNVAETVTVSADATGDAAAVANVDDNVIFNGGAATQLVFSVQPSGAQAGVAIAPAIKVHVQDALGNLATSATDTITLAIGTNPTTGVLGGTLAVAAIGGEATFSNVTISRAGDGYTLTSSASGLSGATSNAFNMTPGAPTQLAFTVQPGTALAGRTIPGFPTVEIRDVNGDTITADNSTQVTMAIKSGTGTSGATLSGTVTKTASNGVVTFDDLGIGLGGSDYVLTASATGLTDGDSATFNVDAVLNLSSTGSSDPAQAGQTLTYTLTYSNSSSTETALSVTLTDTIPANTNFLSASDGGAESAGVVTWSLGSLAPGASGTRTMVVQVDSPLGNGTLLTDSATAQSSQGDIATASQITTVQSAPVLAVSLSDSPDPVLSGQQISYTLTFSNSSMANETAFTVTLTSTLPADTTFVSASDGGIFAGGDVTWSLGDLTPGTGGTRTLVVQVDSPLANGSLLTNDVTLQDNQVNTATASQTTTVQSTTIVSVSVSDSPDPVKAGSQITYTISFSNASGANETALGVTLTDTLSSNTTFVSASDGGTVDSSGTLVTWSLGDQAPGASGTRTLVVQVDSPVQDGTLLTNNVMLQHPQGSSATTSESTTVSSPVLSLAMSDSPDPAEAGKEITYTLSFSNSSDTNESAVGVTLTDTLPTNTTFVSASDGGAEASGVVTWSLGNLSPGQGGTRSLVVQVDSPLAVGTLLTNSSRLEDTLGHSSTADQTTTLQSVAFLALSQSNDHDPILPGDQIIVTLTFSNSDSANETAMGVVLTNTLPSNVTFLSASDGGTVDGTGTIVTWSLGDLAPGTSGARTMVVRLASSVPSGEQFTSNAMLKDVHGYSASSSETSVVGASGGGGSEIVVGSNKFDVTFAQPSVSTAPGITGTPLSPTSGLGGTQPPGAAPTRHNIGGEAPQVTQGQAAPTSIGQEETVQTASEQAWQSTEKDAIPEAADSTTQAPVNGARYAIGSETIITIDEEGVQQITITGDRVEVTQQVASVSKQSTDRKEAPPVAIEEETRKTKDGLGGAGACRSALSVSGSHDPEPILIGGRVTLTLTFVNTSGDESFNNVTLKNVLPEGMTFVSASNDGVEAGNVVTWRLGGLRPGEKGTRTLVAQANFADTGAAFLTNNNAFLEDGEGRCAWTGASITIQPVSLGDDDNDRFPNVDEVRCGSDPKDAASTCYSLELLEEDRPVKRGTGLTFTVMLRRNFNYEGEVSFNTPNSIPGVLWTFSRLSAELTPTDGMVSFPFTITTTASTPLGQHKIRIQANSGGMTSEQTLILNVVP